MNWKKQQQKINLWVSFTSTILYKFNQLYTYVLCLKHFMLFVWNILIL